MKTIPKEKVSELEQLLTKDQQNISLFRSGLLSQEDLHRIQQENFIYITKFIETYGYPFIDISSENAYRAAFLAIQHFGDASFLKKIASMFEKASDGQVIKSDRAYLIDRSRVLNNEPQVYGTQYKTGERTVDFFEIEEPELLNKRRQKLGMEPFEDYKKKVEEMFKANLK